MTLNGVMAVTLRHFTEFGKHRLLYVPTHNRRVDVWRNLCTSLLYFVVRVRCRRKESSRSLSHLLMSFLLIVCNINIYFFSKNDTADKAIKSSMEQDAQGSGSTYCRLQKNNKHNENSIRSAS